jgi:hypothetical protein
MYTVPHNPRRMPPRPRRPYWRWYPQWGQLHYLSLAVGVWLHILRLNKVQQYFEGSQMKQCNIENDFLGAGINGVFLLLAIGFLIYLLRGQRTRRGTARIYAFGLLLTALDLLEPRLSSLGITVARDACMAWFQHRIGF